MNFYPKHNGTIEEGNLVLDGVVYLTIERIRSNDEWVQDVIGEMYIGMCSN